MLVRWRMLERKKTSAARDDASRNDVSGVHEAHGPPDMQWTSLSVSGTTQFWDPAISPYAPAPAVLPSGSSATLDAHQSVFAPDVYQVEFNDTRQEHTPAPFQYSSSSLSRALSPPQISSCSSPHNFYLSQYSPNHEQVTMDDIMSIPHGDAASYDSGSEGFMDVDANMTPHLDARPSNEEGTNNFSVRPHGEDASPEQISDASELLPAPQIDPPSPLLSPSTPQSTVSAYQTNPVEPVADPVQPGKHYRAPAQKPSRPSATRGILEIDRPPPRLSSSLPATTLESVLPFVNCRSSYIVSARAIALRSWHTRVVTIPAGLPMPPRACLVSRHRRSLWSTARSIQLTLAALRSGVDFQAAPRAGRFVGFNSYCSW